VLVHESLVLEDQHMAKKQLPSRRTGPVQAALFERIRAILEQARAQVARSVNVEMVRAYWLVGREIVEEEQRGRARAGYGDELIAQLSERLRAAFDRGFTPTNLRYMRLFYLAYPDLLGSEIHHAVRDESGGGPARTPKRQKAGSTGRLNPDLSWTHYRSPRSSRRRPETSTRSRRCGTTGRAASPTDRSTACCSRGWPRAATRRA